MSIGGASFLYKVDNGLAFDEAAAGFDFVAHEDGEDLVGAVAKVEDDFEHFASAGCACAPPTVIDVAPLQGWMEGFHSVFAEGFVALDG